MALHFHAQLFFERACRTDLNLDLFGSAFTHAEVVHRAQVTDNRFVHFVTAHAHRGVANGSVQGDHGDVRRTTTNIHDHVAHRVFDRNAHADRSSHRFVYQVNFLGTGLLRSIDHGTLFHFSNSGRDTHHYTGLHHPQRVLLHALDKGLQKSLDQFEIGNHAVTHRAHRAAFAGRTTKHLLRFETDSGDTIVLAVDSNHRRFVDDNSLTRHMNQRIRRAKVNTDIARKEAEQNPILF